jgi:hypothetical protein
MQPLPPQLELPEGNRFTLPTVSAVRELVPAGGQLPATPLDHNDPLNA